MLAPGATFFASEVTAALDVSAGVVAVGLTTAGVVIAAVGAATVGLAIAGVVMAPVGAALVSAAHEHCSVHCELTIATAKNVPNDIFNFWKLNIAASLEGVCRGVAISNYRWEAAPGLIGRQHSPTRAK